MLGTSSLDGLAWKGTLVDLKCTHGSMKSIYLPSVSITYDLSVWPSTLPINQVFWSLLR